MPMGMSCREARREVDRRERRVVCSIVNISRGRDGKGLLQGVDSWMFLEGI